MFLLPTPSHFLDFQISHYQQRLSEARDRKEKDFLQTQLNNLLK